MYTVLDNCFITVENIHRECYQCKQEVEFELVGVESNCIKLAAVPPVVHED
jgi:hypothetical protein